MSFEPGGWSTIFVSRAEPMPFLTGKGGPPFKIRHGAAKDVVQGFSTKLGAPPEKQIPVPPWAEKVFGPLKN